jgi:phytol kinase
MAPEIRNISVALLSVVYVFSVVGIMDYAVRKGLSADISRKIVHIAAGSWILFWPLYNLSHWTKYLNILPALIWTLLLLIKGLSAAPDDKAVKTMTRTGDRRELLKGPLYFTLIMNIMGTLFLYTPLAMISLGLLSWGDGLAPLFGKYFGKHSYKVFAHKTLEGSAAFIIFGFSGAILFSYLVLGTIDVGFALISALLAVIVEGCSPKDWDNILIPLSTMLVYYFYL